MEKNDEDNHTDADPDKQQNPDLLAVLLDEEGLVSKHQFQDTQTNIEHYQSIIEEMFHAACRLQSSGEYGTALNIYKRNIELIEMLSVQNKTKLLRQHYRQISCLYDDIDQRKHLPHKWSTYVHVSVVQEDKKEYIVKLGQHESMNSIVQVLLQLFPDCHLSGSVGIEPVHQQTGTIFITHVMHISQDSSSIYQTFCLHEPIRNMSPLKKNQHSQSASIDVGEHVYEKKLTVRLGEIERVNRLHQVINSDSIIISEVDAAFTWMEYYSRGLEELSEAISDIVLKEEKEDTLPDEDLNFLRSLSVSLGKLLEVSLSDRGAINLFTIQSLYDSYDSTLDAAIRKKKAEMKAQWIRQKNYALDNNLPVPKEPKLDNVLPRAQEFVLLEQEMNQFMATVQQTAELYIRMEQVYFDGDTSDVPVPMSPSELRVKISSLHLFPLKKK